ncbi:MAG: NAD(P)H-hydrate dehydratase, partial [Nanopusillaceae archaeon]
MIIINKSILKKIYKFRESWVHKGMFGKLGIIAGSYYYSGSPIFVGISALKSGVDLVRIFAPKSIANVIRNYSPDLIVFPYESDFFNKKIIDFILENSSDLNAFTIGNGMYRNKREVLEGIKEFIDLCRLPCVIDADAIYAIENKLNKNFVITPNSHEFYILTGEKVGNDLKERIELVKKYAKEFNCTILLKGHIDIISDGERVA